MKNIVSSWQVSDPINYQGQTVCQPSFVNSMPTNNPMMQTRADAAPLPPPPHHHQQQPPQPRAVGVMQFPLHQGNNWMPDPHGHRPVNDPNAVAMYAGVGFNYLVAPTAPPSRPTTHLPIMSPEVGLNQLIAHGDNYGSARLPSEPETCRSASAPYICQVHD